MIPLLSENRWLCVYALLIIIDPTYRPCIYAGDSFFFFSYK